MFWFNTFNLINNKKIIKKISSENKKHDINKSEFLKANNSDVFYNVENKKIDFTVNYKDSKKKGFHDVNNWEKFKSKSIDLIKLKKKKIKKPLKLIKNNVNSFNKLITKNLFKFLEVTKIKNINRMLYFNKNKNYLNFYFNINLNKIFKKNLNNLFNYNYIIIIDFKKRNSNIVILKNLKCFITVNNGFIFKKLKLNNKKYIKSNKLIFIALKTIFLKVIFKKNDNIIINLKGLLISSNYNKVVNYLDRFFLKKVGNVIYLNNFKKSKSIYFGFKKIKSIKRKLKKKNIKKII